MLLNSFAFAVQVTFPIAAIILLGVLLKKLAWINDEFANMGSRLVFNITLPCLLFTNIAKTDLALEFPGELIVLAVVLTTLFFLFYHIIALRIPAAADRGAFVQGACRGNMAIIGLAVAVNAFGKGILPLASMYLAVVVVFYNIYSILTLSYHRDEQLSASMIIRNVLTNPLALAILLALLVAYMHIPIPVLLNDTGEYLARMTLPLALLCAGASIRLSEFKSSIVLYYAIGSKIILIPSIATCLAYATGFRGEELGLLYFMMSAPTAAAAYPMARAMGANHYLTAAIIAGSTLLSIFTTTLGLFLLRYFLWI